MSLAPAECEPRKQPCFPPFVAVDESVDRPCTMSWSVRWSMRFRLVDFRDEARSRSGVPKDRGEKAGGSSCFLRYRGDLIYIFMLEQPRYAPKNSRVRPIAKQTAEVWEQDGSKHEGKRKKRAEEKKAGAGKGHNKYIYLRASRRCQPITVAPGWNGSQYTSREPANHVLLKIVSSLRRTRTGAGRQ